MLSFIKQILGRLKNIQSILLSWCSWRKIKWNN